MTLNPMDWLRAMLADPLGALEEMRQATPSTQVAALALATASVVMVVIDFTYGPFAFPHSMEGDGKRVPGPLVVAVIEVTRAFAIAWSVWTVGRFVFERPVTRGQIIWMTCAFALALVALELLQMGSWLLLLATGLNLYGATIYIGFVGAVLVLVAVVHVTYGSDQWLSSLLVAAPCYVLGYFLAPFVAIYMGFYVLWERLK